MYTGWLTTVLLASIATAKQHPKPHTHHKGQTQHHHKGLPTGKLPSPSQFSTDQGKKWSCDYVGDLAFTGTLQKQGLGGDKCRTSKTR